MSETFIDLAEKAGFKIFKNSIIAVECGVSGVASESLKKFRDLLLKEEWIPLTPGILHKIELGEFENEEWWIATEVYGKVYHGVYEWRQGRRPHGFNVEGAGRYGADEISHVMPFKKPNHPNKG